MTNVRRVTWLLAHAVGGTTWCTSCSTPAYSVPSSLQDDDDLATRGSSGQRNDGNTGIVAARAAEGGVSAGPASTGSASSGGTGGASHSSHTSDKSLGASATSPVASTGGFPASPTLVGGVANQAGGAYSEPTAIGTSGTAASATSATSTFGGTANVLDTAVASSSTRAEMTSGGAPVNTTVARRAAANTVQPSAGGTSSRSTSKTGAAGGNVGDCTEPSCSGVTACSSGYADCDDDLSNGCETATGGNLEHCGACRRPCDSQCVEGVCATTPCTGLCESPRLFTIGSGTIYGLAKKVCHESYEAMRAFNTGQCGLFTPGHPLYINGIEVTCDTGDAWNWSTLTKPIPRHGGYCFHDDQLGTNGTSAWFTTW